ncbi:unnamed protein product [Rhizoctonia solani]|uniref:Uncharacterized protein n=1 Tax=Rhizoctonia solani TaxID=456999 RepID=A0A8H3DYJ6_9AGAM|nr:unnamed protein product [Rhizoctonia solani]
MPVLAAASPLTQLQLFLCNTPISESFHNLLRVAETKMAYKSGSSEDHGIWNENAIMGSSEFRTSAAFQCWWPHLVAGRVVFISRGCRRSAAPHISPPRRSDVTDPSNSDKY